MKESKVIMIGNNPFKVYEDKASTNFSCKGMYQYKDIYGAYDRPSACKIEIWNTWVKTLINASDKNKPFNIFISSRNAYLFTISGYMFIDNTPYNFHITKTRLELYPVIIYR